MVLKHSRLVSVLLALAVTSTACQIVSSSTSGMPGPTIEVATPVDIPEPTATTPPEPTAAPDPASLCPTPGTDQALHVNRENGYCFLYPAYFEAKPDVVRPDAAVSLLGPAEIKGQEGIAVNLSVAFNGPADGLDSQAYAAKWREFFYFGDQPEVETITLGGQPAALIRNAPGGYANQQIALAVVGGLKYQVSVLPQPEDSAALAEHVRLVWDTVTQTIVFFPPTNARPAVRAADVCPAATADTRLWVKENGGFCLLYPADYELDPEFPGRIIGGPILADTPDWGQVRTSIYVATYDQPPAALEQALTPPTEQIDPASVQQTTIGGAPAILYDFTGGPWRQRTASLAANGSVYTMVGPWDAERFPGSEAEAERLWNTVTGSLTFFDKWR